MPVSHVDINHLASIAGSDRMFSVFFVILYTDPRTRYFLYVATYFLYVATYFLYVAIYVQEICSFFCTSYKKYRVRGSAYKIEKKTKNIRLDPRELLYISHLPPRVARFGRHTNLIDAKWLIFDHNKSVPVGPIAALRHGHPGAVLVEMCEVPRGRATQVVEQQRWLCHDKLLTKP